jgi:SAM-dependent MidA family methyltransferase
LSQILEKITDKIRTEGAIPFATFMDLALYCPDCGFYEKEKDNIGKDGDFFTSVSVGGLFGELLAFQFGDWLEAEDRTAPVKHGTRPAPLRIVEAGAHDGQLAGDILSWLCGQREETFDRLEYYIIEPSVRRREWQQEKLKDFKTKVKWATEISTLRSAPEAAQTVIFSNELLDAMPVHRLGWDAKEKKWFEWGVALEGERFAWSQMPAQAEHVSSFTFQDFDFQKLLAILPDHFTVEISPAAETWWRIAAEVLKRGKLLAIDYGFTAEDQFSPHRRNGTLRAYHRHQVTDDVLAYPGEQDLTAHVNFSAIQKIGEDAGLRTESFCTQPRFLMPIVQKLLEQPDGPAKWSAKQTRQLQTLTHPEHLGRAFRVLVQSR